ncbi:GNAT family N-acetyltransferase [Aureimonas fodinaquatilis]|uniref:GNAT family N-acetyltransferase n=1 Tax=Aureimonas fodinaquatilis TaxID=2565783 RepID=A0A5B0E0H0_9HYPH|nr:GNAT family N-acetyltransferase [Aureimonas fodinaquatilis]KAA0971615.1 GNAT family N-acetyltransferase [Aureimonas fodinaquatilis]
MATTEADRLRQFAITRRLEAAGFRAWPATSTHYDGTWAVRLTTSFPAKRLNSVNPLDPSDNRDIAGRIERAKTHFARAGRPLLFRQSPLAPPDLVSHLDAEGWRRFGESIVFTAELDRLDLSQALDRIPIRDMERYLDASLVVHQRPAELRAGLFEVLSVIRPPAAYFVRENAGGDPMATALAITDNDLAGILDVAVLPSERRQGIGRDLIGTALRHTQHKGARTGWLQVEADNVAGVALYHSLGFKEAYRYVYRQKGEN